jgi:drug/metabolite transporter (DMT)-like permease
MGRRAADPAWSGTVATTVAVALWGLSNVLIKHLAADGLTLALDRLWIGAATYAVVHLFMGGRVTWRTLRLSALGGITFSSNIALFWVALRHTTVADATVIGALQPALVLLVAGPLFEERVNRWEVVFTIVGIGGVATAVMFSAPSSGRTWLGDLLAAGALVAFTAYFVASKRARAELPAMDYQVSLLLVGVVVMTPVVLLSGHGALPRHPADLGWAALIALVPGSGHLLVNWAHRAVGILVTSMLTLGIPVVSIAGAAALLSEPLRWAQIVGVAITVSAVGLVLVAAPKASSGSFPVRIRGRRTHLLDVQPARDGPQMEL